MSAFEYKEYSVLMSVYHKERPEYLKQAIESIQVQSLSTNDFVLMLMSQYMQAKAGRMP